jgi:hypothetical protein
MQPHVSVDVATSASVQWLRQQAASDGVAALTRACQGDGGGGASDRKGDGSSDVDIEGVACDDIVASFKAALVRGDSRRLHAPLCVTPAR